MRICRRKKPIVLKCVTLLQRKFFTAIETVIKMKNWKLVLGIMFVATLLISCDREDPVIVWSGATITFEKAAFADPTLEENQDRITENVWITRGALNSIYNAVSQSSGSTNPAGTEWAFGKAADYASLTFDTFQATHEKNAPSVVGRDMVLHLIEDDIYIDVRFTSWARKNNNGGGAFSYERSTAN